LDPNGSNWLEMAQKDSKWLEMAPKVLQPSNQKAKKCQKKGAIKVFFKELKVQKIPPPPQKKKNKKKN